MIEQPANQLAIDELAAEFTDRLRQGERPGIDEYVARSHLSSEIHELFPAIEAMERLKGRKEREFRGRTAPPHPQRLGDFRILAEVGRGGMGIVYEAVQESLGRHVALKVLPRPSLDQRRLRRFRREAQMAARLHHTNIVPVLGVGEDDGHHFIVMQYIRGVGLDEVIGVLARRGERRATDSAERHAEATTLAETLLTCELPEMEADAAGRAGSDARGSRPSSDTTPDTAPDATPDGSTPPELSTEAPIAAETASQPNASPHPPALSSDATEDDPPAVVALGLANRSTRRRYWQNVARLGAQAADALRYAHQLGTMHRDIKPGNLLLDWHGNLWVADFGLAKAIEQEAGSHSNDVVGTLRYMAPEQLRGQTDPRSDIYSLGLALYELLALQPAFEDRDRRQHVLDGSASRDPVRPRRLNPSVPRDLETIVLKAAAHEPQHRYASARELADDLRAFVEDRPIKARRVSPAERLVRWCRRNRALAAACSAAVTLLVLVAVVASAGYWQTRRAFMQVDDALSREKHQRRRSEATLDISLEALDRVYQQLAPVRMMDVTQQLAVHGGADLEPPPAPALTVENAELLEDILTFYDRFAEQSTGNVRLAEETARANRRVGDIQWRLGQFERAEAAYRRAIDIYRSLARQPDGERFQVEAARIYNELGVAYRAQRANVSSRAEWRRLARSQFHAHQHALQALQPPGDGPAKLEDMSPAAQFELAKSYYLLALHEATMRRRSPHDDSRLEAAVLLLEQLSADHHEMGDYRHLLALCLRAQADTPLSPKAERAIDYLEQLVRDYPQASDYRFDLVESYIRGDVRSAFSRSCFRDRLQKALDHSEQLVDEHQVVLNYVHPHVSVLQRMAALLTEEFDLLEPYLGGDERSDFSRSCFEKRVQKALDHSQQLVDEHPDVLKYVQLHVSVLQRKAALLTAKAESSSDVQWHFQMAEAEQLFRQAVDYQRTLASRFPDEVSFHFWLANSQILLADHLLKTSKLSEALQFAERSIAELYSLPPSRSNHSILATSFQLQQSILKAQGKPAEASDAADNAAYHRLQLRRARRLQR